MVPPASHRVSRVPWYSGSYLKSSRLKYWAVTIYGGAFQLSSSTIPLHYDMSATPAKKTSLVWPVPRSLAATYGIEFLSLPPGTSMFQFSGFPSHDYVFIIRYLDITLSEFPHSEIFGSKFTCNSPKLIAAYHVLHRLLVPRHSPCTLNNLTSY